MPVSGRQRFRYLQTERVDPTKLNAVLAIARPDELPVLLREVALLMRCGSTPEDEATEWRRRIVAWCAFYGEDAARRATRSHSELDVIPLSMPAVGKTAGPVQETPRME